MEKYSYGHCKQESYCKHFLLSHPNHIDRALYDYLIKEMGLRVQFCTLQKGRGPAWHRANDLFERDYADNMDNRPGYRSIWVCRN